MAVIQKTRVKKEPPDEQPQEKDPLDAQPEIIKVDHIEPKKVQVKLSLKEKHLQVRSLCCQWQWKFHVHKLPEEAEAFILEGEKEHGQVKQVRIVKTKQNQHLHIMS